MASQHLRIEIENGLLKFHCPNCGSTLLDQEYGLTDDPCRHTLFIIDWIGELAFGESVSGNLKVEVERILQDEDMVSDNKVGELVDVLPSSSVIFELIEPAQGGGHDGSSITFCIDFVDD